MIRHILSKTKALLPFLSLALALTLAGSAWGQTAGDYRTNATGTWNWTTVANWEIYDGASWVAASKYPGRDDEVETLTILSGADVSLTTDVSNPYLVYYRIKNLTIESGAQLTAPNNVTLTSNIAINGGTLSISSGNFTLAGNLTLSSGSIIVASGAKLTVKGELLKLGGTVTNDGTAVFAGNFDSNGSITTSTDIYIFDDTPALGTDSFTYKSYNNAITDGVWTRQTWYSYRNVQDQSWSSPQAWTLTVNGEDSDGTGGIPSYGDIVYLVQNRNIVLTEDISTRNLSINIASGSTLTLGSYEFTSTADELNGKGSIRISKSYFPTITSNTFTDAEGGTVEFYNFSSTLPSNAATFNNLLLNSTNGSDNTFTLGHNLTLNGSLTLTRSTTSGSTRLTIGNSTTPITLSIAKNFTVGENTLVRVGTADAIHQIAIGGNMVNNGSVILSNSSQYSISTNGAAEVTFTGAASNSITGTGTTLDFYRLIVDKGVDQTHILDVNPVAFRLFYVTNLANSGGTTDNPGINKALWIKNGTLKLGPNIIIEELTSGGNDFFIPLNGALWINGASVSSTRTSSGNSGLTIIGKFRMTSGTYNGNTSAGIVFRGTATLIFEGGEVNISQFRRSTSVGTASASYTQTGGTINVGATGETNQAFARVALEINTYTFVMSGGTINILSPTNTGALAIGVDGGNYSVSGGTINITIPSGNTNVALCSKAPLYNLNIIKSGTGTGGISLQDISSIGEQPLVVNNNLTLSANARLITNDLDLSIAGNFTLENGASYVHGSNTTTFFRYGTSSTAITNNSGTTPLAFNNLTINKSDATSTFNDAKTVIFPSNGSPSVNVLGGLTFDAFYQTLDLNNAPVRVQKNFIVNRTARILNDPVSGIIMQPATPEPQSLTIGKLTTTNNFELNNAAGAKITENSSMGTFTLTAGQLYIGNKRLTLNNPVAGSGFNEDKMVSTNGTSGELRYIYNGVGASVDPFVYPVGTGAALPEGEDLLEWEENFTGTTIPTDWTQTQITLNANWTFNGGDYAEFSTPNNNTFSTRLETPPLDLTYSSVTLTFLESRNRANGGQDQLQVQYNVGAGWVTLETYTDQQAAFIERTISLPAECRVNGCRLGFLVTSARSNRTTRITDVMLTNLTDIKKYTPLNLFITGTGNFTASNDNYFGVMTGNNYHPLYITGTETQTLKYYWKTIASGEYTGTLTFQNQFFFYDEDKIIDGGAGSRRAYKLVNNQWSQGTQYQDNFSAIDPTGRIRFENAGFQPGHYTAGTVSSFNTGGGLTTYYSRNVTGGGNWESGNTWSTDDVDQHAGDPAGTQPGATDQVVIAPGHTVTITSAGRSANLVQINEGAVLNVQNFTGHTFDDLRGDGILRLSTATLPTVTQGYDNFTQTDLSTIEFYGATGFSIPSTILTYYNLLISGSGAKPLPNQNLTIRNNLTVDGSTVNLSNGDKGDLTIENELRIINGGVLTIPATTYQRTITTTNVFLDAATFDVVNGAGTTHTLSIEGGGIVTSNSAEANLFQANNNVNLTLSGAGNTYVGNGGSPIYLNRLVVNKQNLFDEVSVQGQLQLGGATNGATKALEIASGTFIIERTEGSAIDLTLSSGGTFFNLPETSALIVQGEPTSPNVIRVSGGSGMRIDGLLRLAGNAQALFNTGENYLEYSSSGKARIEVLDNAVLNLGGQLRRRLDLDAGVLNYYQTGGEVYIGSQGASQSTRGVFEILNENSSFTHTGGILSIGRSSGFASGDIYLEPASHTIGSGATLTIEAQAASQNIALRASIPLGNLNLQGTNSPTVTLNTHPIELEGNLSIASGATFATNNLSQTYRGNFTNSGTFTQGTSTSYFEGTTQTITGVTSFYDLYINPSTSVTLASSITIDRDIVLLTGTFNDGGNYADVKRHLYNNATHASSNPAAGGIRLSGTAEQLISTYTESAPTTDIGVFGRLELSNTAGARMMNRFDITNDLTLTAGILNIQNRLLNIGEASTIQGAPFSSTKMIQTGGDGGDLGVRKFFDSAITNFSFEFPIGVAGKYTPLNINNATLTQDSYLKVLPVNYHHPTIIAGVSGDPSRVLQYYWDLSSDIDEFNGNLVFSYHPADAFGNTAVYYTAHLKTADDTWAKLSLGFSETPSTITWDYTTPVIIDNFNGFYTAGEEDAIPNEIAVFTAIESGDWDIPTKWDVGISPPNGIIVDIPTGIEIDIASNRKRLYRTRLDGTLDINHAFTFHNLGLVTGTGTLKLNNDFIPPGNYTDFISCGAGTIEYSGGTYTITDNYLDMNGLTISGTGVKTLPNNNINLCADLNITETSTLKMYPDAARNLNIKGNMTKEAGASFLKSLGCRVIFSGTSTQLLSGDLTGTNSFCQLQVNNSTGLTISGQAEATTELHLTSGIVTTTNPLILSSASGLMEYSSTSYISGPFSRLLPSTAGTYYFPLGKSNRYKLSALINPSTQDYYTMEYFRANPGNTTSLGVGVSTVSLVEYWEVTGSASESANIQFSLSGTSDVAAAVADINNLRIVRWSGSAWEIVGGGAVVVGPIIAGTITTTDPVTFSGAAEKFALATVVPVSISSVGFETADMTVCIDDNASVELEILLTGTSPWQVKYRVNGGAEETEMFTNDGNPYLLTISPPTVTSVYVLTEVRDNNGAGDPGNLFNETVTVTIIQKPVARAVTSGGNICSGQSTSITVANTDSNFSYELVRDGALTGTILAGNDGDLIFSNITVAGEYRVYGFTSGYPDCYQEMSNPVTIAALVAPTATLSLSPAGSECEGTDITINIDFTGTNPYAFKIRRYFVDETSAEVEQIIDNSGAVFTHSSEVQYSYQFDNLTWYDNGVRPAEATEYHYTLIEFTDSNGCPGTITPATINIWKRPETGPQYHIPNTFGE